MENLYLMCLPPQGSTYSHTHSHIELYPPQGWGLHCDAGQAEALRQWICRQKSSQSDEGNTAAPQDTTQGRECDQNEAWGGLGVTEQQGEPVGWSYSREGPGRKDFLLEEIRILPTVRSLPPISSTQAYLSFKASLKCHLPHEASCGCQPPHTSKTRSMNFHSLCL